MTTTDPIQLLYGGMAKLGPGSDVHTLHVLNMLPKHERRIVVDAGCGTGRQTLALASKLDTTIHAIDNLEPFLNDLRQLADTMGLGARIETHCMDMGKLCESFPSIDLIWSEGAIYNLGFAEGLRTWAPCLAPGGCIVASDLSWLKDQRPTAATEFWAVDYPGMGSIDENSAAAEEAGLQLIDTYTLPRETWMTDFYEVLEVRAQELRTHAEQEVRELAEGTLREIEVFRHSDDSYGYVFYLLQRA